ncbi:LIM/homeobox protein Lhx2-like [Bacillus rossius redtenbacheri]|uniref:LIM/homeobox protein Lhx2-like n=1 Tax=Bacillus rossius redtenbacheri TaxID=93214 RepID=UPI002FDE95B2
MNPHYHPYSELSSPHSPPPDAAAYHPHHPAPPPPPPQQQQQQQSSAAVSNGHGMAGGPHAFHHHHHHHNHPHHHPHHHHHPHLGPGGNNNNNNNNSNSTNNNCPTVKVCAGCGGKIVERFLLHALDRYWHNNCLKCSCCGACLADIGGSCFTKANMILCKTDYIRLFGNTGACSACGQTIPASEFVMRAGPGHHQQQPQQPQQPQQQQQHHVFHMKCFACSKCGAQLVPGDRYCLLAGSLVCEQDWHKLLKGSAAAAAAAGAAGAGATGVRKGKVGRPRRSRD